MYSSKDILQIKFPYLTDKNIILAWIIFVAVGSAVAITQGFFLYFIISSLKMGPVDPPSQSSELATNLPQLQVSSHFSGQTKLCMFMTASMGRWSGMLWVRQPLGQWLGLTEMMAIARRQANKIPVPPSPGGVFVQSCSCRAFGDCRSSFRVLSIRKSQKEPLEVSCTNHQLKAGPH